MQSIHKPLLSMCDLHTHLIYWYPQWYVCWKCC